MHLPIFCLEINCQLPIDDLDLWVTTPNGTLINFLNPEDPSSGGMLDVDACVGCCLPGSQNVENIFFLNPPAGTYTYLTDLFDNCPPDSPDPDDFRLEVFVGGTLVEVQEGTAVDPPVEYTYIYAPSGMASIFNAAKFSPGSSSVNPTKTKRDHATDRQE